MINNFIGVEIEGFCNIQSLYYRLNRPGVNILRAPNGTGKTKIFSSLSWALFGKMLGDSNNPEPWEDKKGKNYKGTKVTVTLKKGESEYSVIRCKNYKGDIFGYPGKNRVILCIDGKPHDKLRDTSDVQSAIDKLLGYSFVVFKNSIIFGQKLTRLIGESGPAKKAILEEVFSISFIEEAKERGKKKLSESTAQYNKLTTEISVLEHSIKSIETDLIIAKNNSESWKSHAEKNSLQVKADLKQYKQSISRLTISLEELRTKDMGDPKELYALYKNLPSPKYISEKVESLEDSIEDTKKSIQSNKNRLNSYLSGKCPECGTPTSKPGKVKELKDSIKSLRAKLLELNSTLGELNTTSEKHESSSKLAKAKYDEAVAHQNKIDSILNGIELNTRGIKSCREKLDNIKSKKLNPNPYIPQITSKSEELISEQDKLSKVQSEMYIVTKERDNLLWAINDPLSNRGIKAYIFEHSLKKINRECRKYSKILGFGVNFSINLDSETKGFQTTIVQGDKERDYKDLSGGQQQLVDVCIAFAMHDVVSVNSNTNILIMDEVFESLDAANIEKVADLIKVKANNNCVHLITHRNDFVLQNVTNLKLIQKSYELAVRVV